MDRRVGQSLRERMAQLRREQQQNQTPTTNQMRGGGAAARGSEAVSVAGGPPPLTRVFRQARASGHLNASSRALAAFPADILRLHELTEGDEKSWESQPLTKVDLSYNEIPSLPPTINKLHVITSIKLRHNKLAELPDEFFDLATLTSIDLSNNLLEGRFPDALGRLTKLREIGLEHNKLTALPDSLCDLPHLESLRVEENQLTALPDAFGNLKRLHTLGAHANQLRELPASFSQLTNLTTLDLKKNSLETIGRAVERLTRLRFLDLRNNKLQEFPFLPAGAPPLDQLMLGYNALTTVGEDSILRAKEALTVLDLRDNKLQELPERFAQLYRLKTLDLSNNDLHDLLPGLGYLKDLNHIAIDGNPLRSIRRSAISAGTQALKKYLRTRGAPPAGVDALEQEFDEFALRDMQQKEDEQGGLVLENNNDGGASQHEYLFRDAAASGMLHLVDMRLQTLPEPIHGAGKYKFAETLLQLNLSRNRLVELTRAIGELTALQTLTAEECGLTSIDASIAMLSNLQHLRLRKNALTTDALERFLAPERDAGVCLSLKELDLRNNQLKQMPTRFRFLVTVDTLLLSYNRLQFLDEFPWAAMRQLSVVSLADNQLESIGAVYELPRLTSLSVENNNLRQIPAELGACENLRALYIAGNPQRSVRLNIVSDGTEAILKYLRNRLPIGYESPAKSFVDTAPRVATTRSNNQEESAADHRRPPAKTARAPFTATETHTARTLAFGYASSSSSDNNQTTHASPNPADYKRARRASAVSSSAHVDLRQPSFGSTPQRASAATPTPKAMPPPAPTQSSFQSPMPVRGRASSSSATSGSDNNNNNNDADATTDLVMLGYDEKIRLLETQLEDYALSQPKKFALKKELAMVRSLKIRHVRAKEQAK